VKPPEDLETTCGDLKVCGRRELFGLLKFRHKYQHVVDQAKKKVKSELDKVEKERLKEERDAAMDSDAMEEEADKELEATIKRVEKERKKQQKKERERKVKSDIRAKMSVIASTDIYNTNDEVLFDRKTLEKLKKIDIEELPYDAPDSNEALSQDEMGGARFPEQRGDEEDESDEDDSADPETKRIESMAKGMEEYYSR
jgi:hypothetical protein